jgi:hypothetical protein
MGDIYMGDKLVLKTVSNQTVVSTTQNVTALSTNVLTSQMVRTELNLVNFPVVFDDSQLELMVAKISSIDIFTLPRIGISKLAEETQKKFGNVLNGYLSKINRNDSPEIFNLLSRFDQLLQSENLDDLISEVMADNRGVLAKFFDSVISSDKKAKAIHKNMERLSDQLEVKTGNVVKKIDSMQGEFDVAKSLLEDEVNNMEALRRSYAEIFGDFAFTSAFIKALFIYSEKRIEEYKSNLTIDISNSIVITELEKKLEDLRNLSIIMEAVLTKNPLSQNVIAHIEDASVKTYQELSLKSDSRINSIKENLLMLNSLFKTKRVQQLLNDGVKIDESLELMRSKLTKDLVTTTATKSSENRLSEVERLALILVDIEELRKINNEAKKINMKNLSSAEEKLKEVQDIITGKKQLTVKVEK